MHARINAIGKTVSDWRVDDDQNVEIEFSDGSTVQLGTPPDNEPRWKSRSKEVIDEVNDLLQEYDAVTGTRQTRRRAPPRSPIRRQPAFKETADSGVGPDFFKKMFLFMMSEIA